MSLTFYRQKEIMEANLLIFAKKQSEVGKMRGFAEDVKGFLELRTRRNSY